MKATLKFADGREFAVDVSEEELKQIKKPAKKTGYEWVKDGEVHYIVQSDNHLMNSRLNACYEEAAYQLAANYYSDKTVAENNARADTLMRKLRRFAVEHRETEIDWEGWAGKFYIEYNYDGNSLETDCDYSYRSFGKIYFDSIETANDAISEFKDELLWYFTEYKDSL